MTDRINVIIAIELKVIYAFWDEYLRLISGNFEGQGPSLAHIHC